MTFGHRDPGRSGRPGLEGREATWRPARGSSLDDVSAELPRSAAEPAGAARAPPSRTTSRQAAPAVAEGAAAASPALAGWDDRHQPLAGRSRTPRSPHAERRAP